MHFPGPPWTNWADDSPESLTRARIIMIEGTSSTEEPLQRRPYQPPCLVVHGTLAELTEMFKNSGGNDGDLYSGGAA